MPQPTATAAATQAAAASSTPGAAPPILGAWLVVRRRTLLSFARRRYVVLTDDHVLIIDSTPVLHIVDCHVSSNASAKVIDLAPAPGSGLPVRIFADSPFQYSKWRAALQTSAAATLRRYYALDPPALIGVGVHGIVRRAYPHLPIRDHSIESVATATTTATSTYSASQYHPHLAHDHTAHHSQYIHQHPHDPHGAAHRSISASRRLFKRRHAASRNSVDLDPDPLPDHADSAVPSSRNDKRFLRQPSLSRSAAHLSAYPSVSSADDLAEHHHSHHSQQQMIVAPLRPVSVAVKTISRVSAGPATVASEVLFAKARLNHFAIIRVLDMFETVNEVHVVTEECMGGSLTQHIQTHGPLAELQARAIFSPLLKAVGFMHASGIVHWDLCPNNVLFLNSFPPLEPKLIDFGTARPIDPANGRVPHEHPIFSHKGKVASLACASPELLTSKAHRYAAKADMWQIGCILYFILVGKLPFSKRNSQDLSVSSTILAFCKKRSADRKKFLFGQDAAGSIELSEPAMDLVIKLLCPNPRMRPNALQCLREFPFITRSKS